MVLYYPVPATYVYITVYIYILVGGFNHLENMKVNGKDYPIYYGK